MPSSTPLTPHARLSQSFFLRDASTVARELLGKTLVHELNFNSSQPALSAVQSPVHSVVHSPVHSAGPSVSHSTVRLAARIVETEAYLGVTDRAAHSFGDRRTARTESMYLAGGHAYVFLVYGMHSCFNVVTSAQGQPEAVLIRAVQPIDGIETMAANRKLKDFMLQSSQFFNLANGPGKLCQAMAIDRSFDRVPLFTNFDSTYR